MSYIDHLLRKHPMIPAIKEMSDLDHVCLENNDLIFLLNAELRQLRDYVAWAQEKDKLVFLHMDLARGIGKDREGIAYLAEEIGIDGIVTTKNQLIRYAKECNLTTVQRLFIVDSGALHTGLAMVRESQPDLVEVLPGIAIPHVKQLQTLEIPVIAGGLITSEQDIATLLQSQAIGISTTNSTLWKWGAK